MFRRLLVTGELRVGDDVCTVRYFEMRTQRGRRRFSADVRLPSGDSIILDEDSLPELESRLEGVVPATVYSRRLVTRPTAA
jgi:hypothetical protein